MAGPEHLAVTVELGVEVDLDFAARLQLPELELVDADAVQFELAADSASVVGSSDPVAPDFHLDLELGPAAAMPFVVG